VGWIMGIVVTAIDVAFQVYTWLLIIRILLSWFPRLNPYHPVIRFIYEITEPFLVLFRRVIPPIGAVDFSPIIALFVLQLIRQVIVGILWRIL